MIGFLCGVALMWGCFTIAVFAAEVLNIDNDEVEWLKCFAGILLFPVVILHSIKNSFQGVFKPIPASTFYQYKKFFNVKQYGKIYCCIRKDEWLLDKYEFFRVA
jgi:hypothetical protein